MVKDSGGQDVPSEGAECGRYSLPRAIHLAFIVSVLYSTFLVAPFFIEDNRRKRQPQKDKIETT